MHMWTFAYLQNYHEAKGEWLGRRIWNPEVVGLSPTGISCFSVDPSSIQLLVHVCKQETGLRQVAR